MRVFVAGATGAIGRPLVSALRESGHSVLALARSDANERALRDLGAEPRRADLFDAESLSRAAEGADVVIRAATRIPTTPKPKPEEWAPNDRIRREGTAALLEAARKVDAKLYLQESIVWLARPDDGAPYDERSPPRPDDVTRSALDAERAAREYGERHGLATGTLRLGFLYGPDAAHTRAFAHALRARKLPVIGRGDAPLAFLHTRDAARAFVAAAERGRGGLWHVLDDRPAPIAEFLDTFARRIGAPKPMRVPKWIGRLGAGAYITKFLTTPMRATNAPFKRETGWKPEHATIQEGLEDVGRGLGAPDA